MLRTPKRSTMHGLLLLIGTVALGLASRRYPAVLPEFVSTYAGDVLWASMVFWLLTLVRPNGEGRHLAAIAFAIAVAVEVSQRYHAPWIDAVRALPLGALALGQGFLWSDVACYLVGVILAAWIDWSLRTRRQKRVAISRETGR
ncbi:DUF2809 domain-containing protein [Gemmatimonas groenlandica]|nr:DUF2809 domain-containing protein [Gemmatimonas groenlandica]